MSKNIIEVCKLILVHSQHLSPEEAQLLRLLERGKVQSNAIAKVEALSDSNYYLNLAKKSFTDIIPIFLKGCKTNKSLSPLIIKSALPLTANSKNY